MWDKLTSLYIKVAYAGTTNGGGSVFFNPLGNTSDFKTLLNDKILPTLIAIGIPILVIFIVYTGYLFVSAQGNEKKLEEAKSALLWTVIGGAILIGAKVIAIAIQDTVGVVGVGS